MHKLRISDLFSNSIFDSTNTFFSIISFNPETYPKCVDFINENNIEELCTEYFGGYSGDKYISPLLRRIYDHARNDLPDPFFDMNNIIAKIIYNRFSTKWKKIYDALMINYKPLENYAMEEVRTPDLTIEETEKEKSKVETKRETSATNSYKGFNASEPIVVNKTDGEEDVTTSGAKADNEVSKYTEHTGTETLVRSGNIGVTTSQQMLESEIKVRQYDFYKQVFNDIDSVLCLSIY